MEIKTMFNFGDIVKIIPTAADKRGQEMVGEIIQVIISPAYMDRSVAYNVLYKIRLNDNVVVCADDPYYYDSSNEIVNGEELKIVAHYTPANGSYCDTTMYAEDGIIKEEIECESGSPTISCGRPIR